ncbi:hypothetical protein HON36_03280 [Candidatus Parcubacteria bacterium]|jgi:hypothetical protein|nr:hypothetical protein [Candidatus Parcubacteria bacterium]MBT7228236.1 hypothetical protein [Candidatus Parcubacteria bacterium]
MSKIILAQENTVLENLVESEIKLRELNSEVETIVNDYTDIPAKASGYSFFNVDNLYFWLLLVGLVFLAFGLVFLMAELKKFNKVRPEVKEVKKVATKIYKEVEKIETREVKKKVKKISTPKKRPVKIKVVKVK